MLRMSDSPPAAASDSPGLASRRAAAEALQAVLHRHRSLDQVLDSETGIAGLRALPDRDRAFVHMLVAKTLRRLGSLRALLAALLERGFPKEAPLVEIVLLIGAAQILFLSVPDHAAVDTSVEIAREDRTARHYAPLVNAVLRRIAREGKDRISALDPLIDTPQWLRERWIENYGEVIARQIAAAHALEPALDLSVKDDAPAWTARLQGLLLPSGTVRIAAHGPVPALPGYDEGAWWVQDAGAALPVKLFGKVAGLKVADLCAAPGGKTAQLAAGGAEVVAVDRSAPRLARLKQNMQRLRLASETVVADAGEWQGGPFDAVLLDAPCTATGTIRRNPDLPWNRQPGDLPKLVALQSRLLDRAATLVRPGGLFVYSTCSLEPEECERQIEALLGRNSLLQRMPIAPSEIGGIDSFVSTHGDLRTFPFFLPNQNERLSGCDGFYAARLRRLA
jgi:16S rRNA (cytosine967-C5)-methyltransferase